MDMITLAMAKSYTDSQRLAHAEMGEVEIFPETFVPGDATVPLASQLVAGETYIVNANGVEYECECYAQGTANCLGDFGIFEEEPDGSYPFYVEYNTGNGRCLFLIADYENCTISIYQKKETIHPIDPKYLPGVCLPVVELSTTFKAGIQYTDEEGKILTAAFEKNTPVVIKCSVDLDNFGTFENTALVWCPITSDNFQVFIASFGGLVLQISDIGSSGKWLCNVQQMG